MLSFNFLKGTVMVVLGVLREITKRLNIASWLYGLFGAMDRRLRLDTIQTSTVVGILASTATTEPDMCALCSAPVPRPEIVA